MGTIDLVDRINDTVARLTCVARLLDEADIESRRPTEESVAGLVLILKNAADDLHAVSKTLGRRAADAMSKAG